MKVSKYFPLEHCWQRSDETICNLLDPQYVDLSHNLTVLPLKYQYVDLSHNLTVLSLKYQYVDLSHNLTVLPLKYQYVDLSHNLTVLPLKYQYVDLSHNHNLHFRMFFFSKFRTFHNLFNLQFLWWILPQL